jgi:two-component system sensor histidine kinase PilS (NtrC family)
MSPLTRQLRWLIGIRLVVITSILLPYFLLNLQPPPAVEEVPLQTAAPPRAPQLPPGAAPSAEELLREPSSGIAPRTLYTLAGLTYLASFFYIGLLRLLPGRDALLAHVQFLGDLLLITALVYVTGGIPSPFSIFYLVVISVASALLRRRAGLTVATAAYALYAGLLLALYAGWLPPAHGGPATVADGTFRLVYNLVVNLFAFYAVAILTSTLAHRITRAERELAEKREDLADLQVVHRDVIESINSGLITTDLDGVVTSVNRAGEEILGTAAADLVGRPLHGTLLLPEARWQELVGASDPDRKLRSDVEIPRRGETVYVGFSISRLTDADGTRRGYILIFQDLTRWRQLQEEVRLKDRMAAVGELAAGIAHEIGNPLAAISGSVQLLARSRDGSGADRKLIDILLKESQRLDRTIKGFLRFARPRERATVLFDIAALLAENFELLRNSEEVTPRHRLELDLDPPAAKLIADPDQVSQIFWNLARNALKAMPAGGTLRVVGRLGGGRYRIRFTDTGHGMAVEERANLFHPFKSFFDSGSGIGMAIVYRIVQEHRGKIRVDSRPGAGTTISIELPVEGAAAAAAPPVEAAAP